VAFVATAHYFEHATSDPADVTGSPKAVWQVYRNSRGQLRFDWGEKVLIVDPVARQYLQLDTTAKRYGSARRGISRDPMILPPRRAPRLRPRGGRRLHLWDRSAYRDSTRPDSASRK